jgi:hypothetical protein
MKHHGARKAKDVDFAKHAHAQRRAARIDLTWRAHELADTDIWQRRTADTRSPRKPRH